MGRDHNILPGVLVELPFPQARDCGPQLHVTFRMADPCRGPEEDREPELLGKFERGLDHVMRFLDACGVKTRQPRKMGIAAGVLFVLGTVGKGIVSAHDHKTTGHAGIRAGHQGIGCHIQPDMLHGAECTDAAPCCSKSILQGHFFIHRPLDIIRPVRPCPQHVDHFR